MTATKAKNGKTITQNVMELLKTFPEARNNDRLLFAYYWALVDEVDFTNFDTFLETFKTATPPSGIQRRRQVINYELEGDETYLPTDERILAYRMRQETKMSVKGFAKKTVEDELNER